MYLKGHFIILLVGGLSSLPGALPEALWVGSFTTSEVKTAESAPQPHVAVVSEEARVPGRVSLLCYLCWWVIVIKTKAKTKNHLATSTLICLPGKVKIHSLPSAQGRCNAKSCLSSVSPPPSTCNPLTWLIPTYGIPSHSPKEEMAF